MSEPTQQNANDERMLNVQACPMEASVNWNPQEDTDNQKIKWYKYFNLLPLSVRWGLADDEISQQILSLAKKYNLLDVHKVGEISRIVRESFFLPATDERLKERVQRKLEITVADQQQFVQDIKTLINEVVRVGNQKLAEVTESIPLIPAMKKYPELRRQEITKNSIRLFETKEFVTPSIGNWIDDYIQRKGAQAHNNIQRSDYIFNSENGRKLDLEDRKKLGVILDSYDNDNSININFDNQEVIFSHGFEPDKKPGQQEEKSRQAEDSERVKIAPGPPQPQVDVMPEKDGVIPEEEVPLQQWKNQNLQSMQEGSMGNADSGTNKPLPPQPQQKQKQNKVNVQEQNNQSGINKRPDDRMFPYDKAQEIGWFGESTGIDEARRNEEIKNFFGNQPAKEGGQPKTVTRNYREVDELPKDSSKHVVNLKEVV